MKLELDEVTNIQLNFHRKQFGYAPGETGHDRHDRYGFNLVFESESGETYQITSDGVRHWIARGEPMPKPLTLSVNVDPEWDMVKDECLFPPTQKLPQADGFTVSFGPDSLKGTTPEAVAAEESIRIEATRNIDGVLSMLSSAGFVVTEPTKTCVVCNVQPSMLTSLACADCVASNE